MNKYKNLIKRPLTEEERKELELNEINKYYFDNINNAIVQLQQLNSYMAQAIEQNKIAGKKTVRQVMEEGAAK